MNGNIYKSAGITIGIFIGLILAVALILIANNNRKFKTEYDERQLRVRGDAYRYAFYSVIICEVILLILAIGEFTLPIPEYVLHFGGMFCISAGSSSAAWSSPATASGRTLTGGSTTIASATASFWSSRACSMLFPCIWPCPPAAGLTFLM